MTLHFEASPPAMVAGYRPELEVTIPRGCFLPKLPVMTRGCRVTADEWEILPVVYLADNQTLTDPTKPIA